ncbi:hypothetical protein [Streptomyces sp. NPDC001880]
MVAILHGPSLDDGVCMEIGYAAASDVPVIVLTTDFQTYSLTEAGTRLEFPDPLLQAVATRIVRVTKLGPPTLPSAPPQSRFPGFQARNMAQTNTALDATVDALLDLPDRAPRLVGAPPVIGAPVYVEPSPYTAWGRDHRAGERRDEGAHPAPGLGRSHRRGRGRAHPDRDRRRSARSDPRCNVGLLGDLQRIIREGTPSASLPEPIHRS